MEEKDDANEQFSNLIGSHKIVLLFFLLFLKLGQN